MASSKRSHSKKFLKSVLRQTDSHNRHLDEANMWRSRGMADDFEQPRHRSRGRNAHMDEEQHKISCIYPSDMNRPGETSTFWARELQKVEEKDPSRWGHSGYKELYPDEFNSDRSAAESSSDSDKHGEVSRKRKRKREKERRKVKKRKKHRHGADSSEDDKPQKKRSHRVNHDGRIKDSHKDRSATYRRRSKEHKSRHKKNRHSSLNSPRKNRDIQKCIGHDNRSHEQSNKHAPTRSKHSRTYTSSNSSSD